MDRMHIKRLLTICLALMLSVSMLPAGTFALAGTDAALSQEQAGEETGSEDPQTDTPDVAASENPAETPEGEEVVTTPQPETDGDTADKVVEEGPAKEPEAVTKTEQKAAFGLADYLTSDTGVLYFPEDAEDWAPVDETVKLDPAQKVLLHIAYEIPAGTVDKTNAETEYSLPEGLTLSEDEIKAANKDGSVYEGKDRKAADLKKSGQFEIKDGNVLITFSEGALSENDPMTGFFEIEVSASDLLAFDIDGENTYRIRWNDDSSIDTVVVFDEEKTADVDKKDKEDPAESSEEAKTEESSVEAEETPQKKVAASLKKGVQMVLLAAGSGPSSSSQSGSGSYGGLQYDWSMQWANSVSNNYSYEDDGTLLVHPSEWKPATADIRINLTFNDVESLGTSVPPNTVNITVPKSIFKGWDGVPADTFILSDIPDNEDQATSLKPFVYKTDGDNIVIYNAVEFEGQGGNLGTRVTWSVDPLDVNGGHPDDNNPGTEWWDNYVNPYENAFNTSVTIAADTQEQNFKTKFWVVSLNLNF